ncbi:MAG: hemin-degrading factor [Pyrinomonadaceae bacterium]|nr:hemin-degrading factor [Pyrinomonadaceae bacterium]
MDAANRVQTEAHTGATQTAAALKNRWTQLRAEHPHLRTRDAAAQLNVSEAELVATMCGEEATRLAAPEGNWGALIENLKSLGRVMALTRNNEAVSERKGEYSRTELFPSHRMGQVLDEGIDLRLFFTTWTHAFALDEEGESGRRKRSVQFFSADGNAIHKVFLQDGSDLQAFDAYVARFQSLDQSRALEVQPAPASPPERSDNEIDVATLRVDWSGLTSTHDFFGLTRKHNVTRTQALRLAAPDMAYKVENSSLRRVLDQVAESELPIMVFVGNPGCIQIHSGAVSNIKPTGSWLNVLDADFNLHVREDLIHTSWMVRKPTREGIVTSLELYNTEGEQIALLFSRRKDYREESEAWRNVLSALPILSESA